MRRMTLAVALIISLSIVGLVACGGGSKSSTPTPPPAATLSSITVTATGTSVAAGLTLQFTATGHYSDSTTKDLTSTATWTSSDTTIATVASGGLASAVKAGSATIKATSGTVSGTMAMTVDPATIKTLAVSPSSTSVKVGLTQQFTATATYTDNTTSDVTSTAAWDTSDHSLATISASGLLTGVASGNVTVMATDASISGNTSVTVEAAVLTSIALSSTQTTIPVGGTQQIVATGTYDNNTSSDISHSVSWASSDPSVISVDSNGVATAMTSSGTADVTASSNGVTSSKITLTAGVAAAKSIMIVPSTISLAPYQWVKPYVFLIYTDNTAEDVTASAPLSVDSPAVVNLVGTNAGFLTGKAAGSTKLHAAYQTFTASANVTVSGSLAAIALNPKTRSIHQGGEALFALTGTFDNGTSETPMKYVTWNIDNSTIAAFNGPISDVAGGLGAGTTTIRANLGGYEDTATLTVDGYTLNSLTITPAGPINMARNVTVPLTLTGNFVNAATNATDDQVLHNVTWSSTDETVATVDSTGRVFSKHVSTPGTATITATLPNGMTQTVGVNVAPGTLDHITITMDNQNPKVGDVVHFTATAVLSDGRQFDVTPIAIWQSSDYNLALIDASGTFTAIKAGSVTVTAYFANPWTTTVTVGQ